MEALFESDGWGGPDEEPRVSQVWEAIEAVVSRADLRAALALVSETVPPPGAEDPDDWRAELPGRYPHGVGVLEAAAGVIAFGANAEGAPVLAAMRALPDVLAYRSRLPAPLIAGRLIDDERGERPVAAAGVRPPGAPGRRGGPARLRASACWSSSGVASSAARSTPTPRPGGATRRPGCWRRGVAGGPATC